jgi:hypothetical protein
MTTPANNMTISLTDPFSVNDGNGDTATYSYVANSPLVGQITFANGAVQRMTTTKQYDYLNRLTQIASQSSAPIPPVSFNYNYNAANQRSTNLLVDGSYWVYQYDSLGQVTSGHKHFRDNTPVPGQEFDYSFDTIGNRTQTQAGGDQKGANQRVAGYSANNLNQITSRQYPGAADVIGAALAHDQFVQQRISPVANANGRQRQFQYIRRHLCAQHSGAIQL